MPTERAITLTTPLVEVPGIRPRDAAGLRTLGIVSVGQLVAHLPHRHADEAAEDSISQIDPGEIATARGEVTATRLAGFGRKKRFEAVMHDGSARLDLVWFNQPWLSKKIHPGDRLRVQGKAEPRSGGLQMANPRHEHIDPDEPEPEARDARLRPVYPANESIDPRRIDEAVGVVLPAALPLIEDHLPAEFRRSRELPTLADAYRMWHRPESAQELAEARRRLAYDELLLLQLGVFLRRSEVSAHRAHALRWNEQIDARVRGRLPFALTPAQDKVVHELTADLQKDRPANRLIQGDVGSGKTAVALYAMLLAVASGHQAALMAPTELLAEQHAQTIAAMLEGSGVRLRLLTGSRPEPERRTLLREIAGGDADIVIGTHALITEGVSFGSLAVAIIDEQHRFGVEQRARLRLLGAAGEQRAERAPHTLVMTATPIPRTLAITLFGDLDVSRIEGLPPGRQPVATRVMPAARRDEVYRHIADRLKRGERAFIVAPAIADAQPPMRDVGSLVKELDTQWLSGFRIEAVHGQVPQPERAAIMQRLREGVTQAVIATTVIEVGVDVPAATAIVVENADRFGLAQLHQLRGRVGRGDQKSLCVLIADPTTEDAQQRLDAMLESIDGFRIAERDFDIRGPGELIGSRQAGLPPLRVADLARDTELLGLARRDAAAWIERSPRLEDDGDALVRRRLLRLYGGTLATADIA